MPRTTGPIQRVRPANAQMRVVNTQTRAAAAQTPAASSRANLGGLAYQNPATNVGIKASATPVAGCCCSACVTLQCLERTRFFAGQLLGEADLNNEQSYWLAKGRLHNRFLHGWGVVCGLQVSCGECDGWVTINPGYAIDPCGNDVIVRAAQSFNVLNAIQACCTPKQATDCSPLRYRPAATCQDAIQTWCITIQYQEQSSRMITPLQQPASRSAGCGCGCSSSGCGCGCGGSKSTGCGCGGNGQSSKSSTSTQSSSSCSCASASASSSTAACEPTRIVEGFQLAVCQTPATENQQGSEPGTFTYQFDQCYQSLYALLLQRPTLVDANGKTLSDQQAYQATCQYLTSVKNAFVSPYITHCQVESALYAIQIPQPPQDNYISLLLDKITLIVNIIRAVAIDCLCTSLLPPCPPDPCDNRLILACVTVQNGKIINICHFGGGRKQVVTFPVLYYWLSLFGFDKALNNLGSFLELICCGEDAQRGQLFNSDYSKSVAFASGSGNPAAVNQAMASYVAQKLGAAMVNTVSSNTNAVDLRPLVGLNTEKVQAMLESYRITKNNIIQTDVSTDPSWTDAAIAAAPSYAPAAFNPTDSLTMYTRGSVVVGFSVTSPTDLLSAQVARLQQQVSNLSTQVSAAQTAAANATTTTAKKK